MIDFESKYEGSEVEALLDKLVDAKENFYIWYWGGTQTGLITQEEYNSIVNADYIIVRATDEEGITSGAIFHLIKYTDCVDAINHTLIGGIATELVIRFTNSLQYGITSMASYEIPVNTSQLNNDSDFISSTNLKTINGESIVGSGDITIEGGGSSGGGSGAYAEVNHGTSDTTFVLTPNTFHVWDVVSELNLTLGDETSGVANEFLFQFTSGSEATSLTLPEEIKWVNGVHPTIVENMIYQVSILKGLASVLEFSNAIPLTRFYVNLSGDWRILECAPNMTWSDYVNSDYNTNALYRLAIEGNKITYGMYTMIDQVPSDVIINGQYYDMYFDD
jgi:hypothetical protein